MMTQKNYLCGLSDRILATAWSRQKAAASHIVSWKLLSDEDSMVNLCNYGTLDFCVKLQRLMWERNDIVWDPVHIKYGLNDFLMHVNAQFASQDLDRYLGEIAVVQAPPSASKSIRAVNSNWMKFYRHMTKEIPEEYRYMRLSLILLYAKALALQMGAEPYEHLRKRVLSDKVQILGELARTTAIKKLSGMMKEASDYAMVRFFDATNKISGLKHARAK